MEQLKLTIPRAKVIRPSEKDYGFTRILGGNSESVTMRSGLVNLKPGESVGIHSTDNKEELLIILMGEGDFIITGSGTFPVREGEFFYCPPYTEHNVLNSGGSDLKYVYVVAKAY